MMYKVYSKPNILYNPEYDEFYTHLGNDQYFAFGINPDIDEWGLGDSLLRVGSECWSGSDSEHLFSDTLVIATSPILFWEKE